MVVRGQMEPHPATILHAHVAKVSIRGDVGCPHKRQWATEKCAGEGCTRELLGGSPLSDRGSGALTDRLPLEVTEL